MLAGNKGTHTWFALGSVGDLVSCASYKLTRENGQEKYRL